MLYASCANREGEAETDNHALVINELMADNRTGLLNDKGKPEDWIEIKNTSPDTVEVEGYSLEVIPHRADTLSLSDKQKEGARWTFPSARMAGGECLVVFAAKNKGKKHSKELTAELKLPKEGGTVRLLSPKGAIVSEVEYDEQTADYSLSRQEDSSYIKTYYQSPGYDNTREGYEAACARMDEQRHSALLIWELMSRAKNVHSNWVELRNVSDTAIDISHYSIAKKIGKDEGWQLPERTLQPGQVITLQLAGKRARKTDSRQARVKLGDDETLVLMKNGDFMDGVCAKPAIYGTSIGRAVGQKGFFFYSAPSPNANNGSKGRRYIAEMPQPDHKAGIYKDKKRICLHLNAKGRTIRYTLDGSEPTMGSAVYKDSIVLTQSTTVRAFAEGDSASMRSATTTATYLIGSQHEMAVINISVNDADLYDHYNGIYAEGPGYSPEWPHLGANYWKSWTKRAHIEMFDEKGGITADCGLKIFGGFSRYEAKKSFCIKFKSEYGCPEVSHDFFGNGEEITLQDMVLRSGSQDYNRCMVRDEFFTSLLKAQSPTLLTQRYRPVALYINAQYFGLYYIREKIDKHFVERQLNRESDSIDIIMSAGNLEEGSSITYSRLMKYVSTHDMSDSTNYAQIRQMVDLQGLVDYKLGEIYSGNTDVGNIRYVRCAKGGAVADSKKGKEKTDGLEGKWRFVFYDLDATWVGDKPTADYYLSAGGNAATNNVTAHNIMISQLLKNDDFRQLFLKRLSHHLHHTFSEKNATSVFDNLIKQIRPEMERNCKRWPQMRYETWERNIADFRKRFAGRPKTILNDLRKYLSITEEENKKYFGDLGY